MYINMHDGIDFDGFNNLSFEKKIFFDSHILFVLIMYYRQFSSYRQCP